MTLTNERAIINSAGEITQVVFRKNKISGEVFAIFPRMVFDFCGRRCGSYRLFLKHEGVIYRSAMSKSIPAKPTEYAFLEKRLTIMGYRLEIITRTPARLHRDRTSEALQQLFG